MLMHGFLTPAALPKFSLGSPHAAQGFLFLSARLQSLHLFVLQAELLLQQAPELSSQPAGHS